MLDIALKDLLACARNGRELLGDRADTSLTFVLLSQLLYYKDWALKLHRMSTKGELSIGGIVTPILVACDVELKSKPCPPRWIDMGHLRRSKFLDPTWPSDEFMYQFVHPTAGEAKLRLPCTELTRIRVGTNIDFIPPLNRLYAPFQDAPQSEDAEGSDDSVSQDEEDGSVRFGFGEYGATRQSPAMTEAHRRIGLLQKWNKFQGKAIASLKGTVRDLKGQMKEVKDQLKEFHKRFSGSPSKRVVLPKRVLLRTGSFHAQPEPRAVAEPPRASSYEPRQQLNQYSRQRKRRSASKRDDTTTSSSHAVEPTYSTHAVEPTSEPPYESTFDGASMVENINNFFSNF